MKAATTTCGLAGGLLAMLLTACGGSPDGSGPADVNAELRQIARSQGLKGSPMLREPALTPRQREIRELRRELGRLLFFDHALSGVRQTSCGTCHHAAFQFGDGRNIARGVFCDMSPNRERIICHDAPPPGQGGNVVGPNRTAPLNSRNSPVVLNAALFPKQMWNGRFHFVDDSSADVNECDPSLGFEFPPLLVPGLFHV